MQKPKSEQKNIKAGELPLTRQKKQVPLDRKSPQMEGVIKDLLNLGFSDYESRAYVGLLQCGPATAYEVANVAGLPRANVYAVVKKLTEKGAVLPLTDKPVQYIAVDPKELFKGIANNTIAMCDRVTKKLSTRMIKAAPDVVWLYNGQVNVFRKISEMIDSAEHHIWLKGPDHLLEPFMPELYNAAHKGILVEIVLFSSSPESFDLGKNCKIHPHEGNGKSMRRSDNFLTITADSERALIALMKDDIKASYSENPSFTYVADVMLKHEFFLAAIMQKFGDMIKKEFGSGLSELRNVYSPPL